MNIVNPLKWTHRTSDNVVYANPNGMRYGYYIKPNDEKTNVFELAYVEDSGAFKEYGVQFDSLESAQNAATNHYQAEVLANILPEFLK